MCKCVHESRVSEKCESEMSFNHECNKRSYYLYNDVSNDDYDDDGMWTVMVCIHEEFMS